MFLISLLVLQDSLSLWTQWIDWCIANNPGQIEDVFEVSSSGEVCVSRFFGIMPGQLGHRAWHSYSFRKTLGSRACSRMADKVLLPDKHGFFCL